MQRRIIHELVCKQFVNVSTYAICQFKPYPIFCDPILEYHHFTRITDTCSVYWMKSALSTQGQ